MLKLQFVVGLNAENQTFGLGTHITDLYLLVGVTWFINAKYTNKKRINIQSQVHLTTSDSVTI